MTDIDRAERLLEEIRERRGYVLPSHRFLASSDPDFLEAYDEIFTLATGEHSGLSPDVKELVLLAIDLALGINPDIAGKHAQRAVEYGASAQQTMAVVELVVLGLAAKGLNAGIAALQSGGAQPA